MDNIIKKVFDSFEEVFDGMAGADWTIDTTVFCMEYVIGGVQGDWELTGGGEDWEPGRTEIDHNSIGKINY